MAKLAIVFLILMNPFIFGRVIWRFDEITFAMVVISVGIILYSRSSIPVAISKRKLIVFTLLSIYFVSTICIRLLTNQDIGDLVIHTFQFISLVIVFLLKIDEDFISGIYKAIFLSLIFHVWTILPFLPFQGFFEQRLSELTAYPTGQYSIGGLTRRATGFFTAPGYLALYSSICFVLGVSLWQKTKSKLAISIILLSIVCGFASLARTYIVIFAITCLFLFIFSNIKTKFLAASFLIILIIPFSQTKIYDEYSDFISTRLLKATDYDSNDRVTGETGIIMTLNAIGDSPLMGSANSINGGDIKAEFRGQPVRPHLGVLSIVAFYGLIISSFLLSLYLSAIVKITLTILKLKDAPRNNGLIVPIYYAFLASALVCLAEPLVDINLSLFFMLICLSFSSSESTKHRS